MKKLAILLLVVSGLSCKKDTIENHNPNQPERLMVALTADNKPHLKLEYSNGFLVKEGYYSFCETNPTDEFAYEYRSGRMQKIVSTLRSMYSSTQALCDPATGMKSEEVFEYDALGRLMKVVREKTTSEFTYNSRGLVDKQTRISAGGSIEATYEYDDRGNLIKETDLNGRVVNYFYDDKINPYYQVNQRPQWISAFNKSPNNVIKATGGVTFQRTFKYDAKGYPTELLEDNGITYKYIYE